MSSLFDYRAETGAPLLVRLDKLDESFGIEPAHVLADPSAPMVITIGPGRYLSRRDLTRFLDRRAQTSLLRRMGRSVPDDVPDPYASELADAVRQATGEDLRSAAQDRFYRPGSSRERSERELKPVAV
jgi:hypothetical protein